MIYYLKPWQARALSDDRITQIRMPVKDVDIAFAKHMGVPTKLLAPYEVGAELLLKEAFVIESNHMLDGEDEYPPPFDDGRPINREERFPGEPYWEQCH